jgi:hypothetical protein
MAQHSPVCRYSFLYIASLHGTSEQRTLIGQGDKFMHRLTSRRSDTSPGQANKARQATAYLPARALAPQATPQHAQIPQQSDFRN